MRLVFRLVMIALAVALGVRAWVLRPGDTAPAAGAQAPSPGAEAAAVLSDALRSAAARAPEGQAWSVTSANADLDVMVVNVEADRPEDAEAIAAEVVAPLEGRYAEVLIYVRGRGGDGLVRRVQWTPDGGFLATTFDER